MDIYEVVTRSAPCWEVCFDDVNERATVADDEAVDSREECSAWLAWYISTMCPTYFDEYLLIILSR